MAKHSHAHLDCDAVLASLPGDVKRESEDERLRREFREDLALAAVWLLGELSIGLILIVVFFIPH